MDRRPHGAVRRLEGARHGPGAPRRPTSRATNGPTAHRPARLSALGSHLETRGGPCLRPPRRPPRRPPPPPPSCAVRGAAGRSNTQRMRAAPLLLQLKTAHASCCTQLMRAAPLLLHLKTAHAICSPPAAPSCSPPAAPQDGGCELLPSCCTSRQLMRAAPLLLHLKRAIGRTQPLRERERDRERGERERERERKRERERERY